VPQRLRQTKNLSRCRSRLRLQRNLGAPEVAPRQPPTPQYPYSVYLGSFKTPGAVNKALIEYQEKGLSVYWAKVDLRDKGVWFRFFTGYFQTKEEAEKLIRDRNIQGAAPGTTKYANFFGSYESERKLRIRGGRFCPPASILTSLKALTERA